MVVPPAVPLHDHNYDEAPLADENFVVASLHAQAAGVQNIRSLVPIVLDPASSTCAHWRDLVLLTLQRYALDDHVLTDVGYLPVPSCRRMDSVVLSWILGTITVELQDIVRERSGTAHQAWLAIED